MNINAVICIDFICCRFSREVQDWFEQNQTNLSYWMKFLIENIEKMGKNSQSGVNGQEKRKQVSNYYYNILNPSNRIHCDDCRRDISKYTKILASGCDYCLGCFSNLQEYPSHYFIINKLDFPLYDIDWNAEEELLLFEGLQKHGFGNWSEIAELIGGTKSREEVQQHYFTLFLQNTEYLPTNGILSRRDPHGKLVKTPKDPLIKKQSKPTSRISSINNGQSFQRGSLTVNQNNNSKNSLNALEIVGYMPKRGDFEVQYDNDAELLLAQMEFNEDDSEQQKRMKFRLIDIYNQKLNQRIRRKQFVIGRKLLDLKEQTRLQKTRTKQEKEVYNMMKVFARFSTPEEHETLVQGILKQKQIRQRIEHLKQLKSKGFRTLYEADQLIEGSRKKQQKSLKRREDPINEKGDRIFQSRSRKMRRQATLEKGDKRSPHLLKQEEQLCKRFGINHKQYMMIKETILRESIKQGILERDITSNIFRIDRNIVEGVFDFLLEKEQIIANVNELSDYE